MGTKMIVTGPVEITPIPADVYPAQVIGYSFDSGTFGDYVKLEFEITTGTYSGTKRLLIASKKATKGAKGSSKFLEAIETITGKKYKKTDEIDIDEILNKPCRIVLEEPIKKDDLLIQKIGKVLPQAA